MLPKWLQCKWNHIQDIDWQIYLDLFDIFLDGLVGTDGIENHTVAIYKNSIFGTIEKIAITFCKKGLDYCVSTIDSKYEFVSFAGGFYFREWGEKERLKRNCDNNDNSKLRENYSYKKKTSKGVYVTSQKRKKIQWFFN